MGRGDQGSESDRIGVATVARGEDEIVNRRRLLRGMAALGIGARSRAARAARVYRVGAFSSGTREQVMPLLAQLEAGLRDLGYAESRDVEFVYRFGGGQRDLGAMAAELVAERVDVLVVISNRSVEAARRVAGTIPIVMVLVSDPVGAGFVASLARPGGTITGLSMDVTPDVAGRRLALLKETVPRAFRVAVLWDPRASTSTPEYWRATAAAAERLGVTLRPVEVRSVDGLAGALGAIRQQPVDGLVVFSNSITFARVAEIATFAARHRLPAIHGTRAFAEEGGLMAYGPDLPGLHRQAATYVDRILKGARPADLPVEQPSRFELVINARAARALGLELPASVLAQADHLIR